MGKYTGHETSAQLGLQREHWRWDLGARHLYSFDLQFEYEQSKLQIIQK